MNSLQGVSDRVNYFVSINGADQIAPDKILRRIEYHHPLFNLAATPEEEAKKALIAAALERARAEKAQVQPENTVNLTPEQQAEVSAIEARRAEIREMAKPHLRQDD